jgi:negative regulator of flagellin synthesis FlgM
MSPLEIGTPRAERIRSLNAPMAHSADAKGQTTAKPEIPTSEAIRSTALDPGQPPIDAERVAVIRKAVESGTYPIVPARIADAMIAAGLLLRSAK